jgi:flagellar FliL protein
MAKEEKEAPEGEAAPADGAEPEKKGLVGTITGMLVGSKMKMMISAGVLLLLIGGGAGAYFFLFASAEPTPEQLAEAEVVPLVPPTVAFYDVPDIIVNIQTVDGTPAFLKLGLSLELKNEEAKTGITAVMPRVVDQFQAYLRELRIDDLKGSQGVLRLKEELLRRINVAAAPYKVHDVLLKEMIVQ